ncbi:MAG: dihydroorotase [Bacteroidales bacterium]
MHKYILLKNGNLVFKNTIKKADILIKDERILNIAIDIQFNDAVTIDIDGLYVFPGIVDTHVHFREPGLTHKADMFSESAAAIAGGITTVIDMPNTIPFVDNIEKIKEKKIIAKNKTFVNIGFFIGAKIDNLQTLLTLPKNEVAGIKLFMGSSTGNVMIDNNDFLEELFAKSKLPIAVHAESESIIQQNLQFYKDLYNGNIPYEAHSKIRTKEACIASSQKVIELAKKYGTSLHLLHVSTEDELNLCADNKFPNITAEVCIPHLWFSDKDFERYKGLLKCNPSVKSEKDKEELRKALMTDKIYSIATDHAPHSFEEKQKNYLDCPSGTTSIQHSLLSMLELYHQNYIDLPTIALKMAFNPSKKFKIKERGELKPGNYADLAIVDLNKGTLVKKEDLYYKCKWTTFEGMKFKSSIVYTFVNGNLVYDNGKITEEPKGKLIEYY